MTCMAGKGSGGCLVLLMTLTSSIGLCSEVLTYLLSAVSSVQSQNEHVKSSEIFIHGLFGSYRFESLHVRAGSSVEQSAWLSDTAVGGRMCFRIGISRLILITGSQVSTLTQALSFYVPGISNLNRRNSGRLSSGPLVLASLSHPS